MSCVVFLALVLGIGQAPFAHPEIDFKGRLYRAMFVPGPGILSSGDIAQAPEPLRARLSRFLTRRASFSSAYEGSPADVEAVARDAKRRAIERAIVASIEADGVAALAVAFVKEAPIAYEWKGLPDGPLAESAYAEQVLQKDSGTPLAPFLYLFIAQRQRAAAEAAESRQDLVVKKAATEKYLQFLQKARAAADPLFGLVADDMQRLPFVYLRRMNDAKAELAFP